jgi:hypothetical protein
MTGRGTSAVRAEVYGMLREVHVRTTAFVTDGNPAPLLAQDTEGLLKRLRWAAESFPTDGRLALGVLRELSRAHPPASASSGPRGTRPWPATTW